MLDRGGAYLELGEGFFGCWAIGVSCGVFVVKRGVFAGANASSGASVWV